ncbi:phosphoglycerate mutase (2,3-diphosphoglycerate-independent) [Chromatiales bacterium (ex Bugula neritina AB1)]|nr:phosphoglycerate mutase (2,3-diphosphoglycerate-independent) [Chromatiales bacterium (ex Bugula neritina AB1)]
MSQPAPRRAVLLIIMDGIGMNPSKLDNAVALAGTPNLDSLYSSNTVTVLEASGAAVGLPAGQMGNSEVGHSTLGCGSALRQDLVVINDSITDGSFFDNQAIGNACDTARKAARPLHLIGLVSDGGVHSHLDHLLALIDACNRKGVKPMLHMITDGRDTAPQCAGAYLPQVESALQQAGGQIATICGRYFAMDRDNRWERVKVAFDAMVHGKGKQINSAASGIEGAWEAGETDEFIKPLLLDGAHLIEPGDSAVFFNFRNDRPRELASALIEADFSSFDRGDFFPISLTTMTLYQPDFPCPVAFVKDKPLSTLGQVIEAAGIAQFHSAETEKYPHVTFFFNGGREEPYAGEERALVKSPAVDTYDLQPEMSAYEVRDVVRSALESKDYGFVVVNLANGDMVGHTGVREAVIRAVEVVDEIVGELVTVATENDFSVVLTADHGNADMLVDPVTGAPHTQHTIFPVACLIKDQVAWHLKNGSGLAAVAPTILQLMGLEQPAGMHGETLLLEEKTH